MKVGSVGWLCWILVLGTTATTRAEDAAPGEDAVHSTEKSILESLEHLSTTLQNRPLCGDRIEKMWKDVDKRNAILEGKIKELATSLEELAPFYSNKKNDDCNAPTFKRMETSCYNSQERNQFPWWRSRFYCWLLGGEMILPHDLEEAKLYLQQEQATGKYWIGGKTKEGLQFPKWMTVEGEWMPSDVENFTTIPRDSNDENCLALNLDNDYQIEAHNCEEKFSSMCKKKTKACLVLTQQVGKDCIRLHGYFKEDWGTAKRKCVENGASLFYGADLQTLHNYMQGQFKNDDWIVWLGASRGGSGLRWLNNERVRITSNHEDDGSYGTCLALVGGSPTYKTKTFFCSEEHSYVCMS